MIKHNHRFVWAGNRFVCSDCGKKSTLKRTPPIVKIVSIMVFFIVGFLILSNSYVNSNIVSTVDSLKQKILSSSGQLSPSNPNLQTDQSNNNTVTNQQPVTVTTPVPTTQPIQASVPSTDTSGQTTQSTQQVTQDQPVSQPIYSKQELYQYALQLINEDRTKNGLPPVNLDNNQAAQAQADDMLKLHQLAHWMSTGEKPYMSYTRFGGLGYVAQNAAFDGYSDIQQCTNPDVICNLIDPKKSISTSEYGMMYNDAGAKIPWGHRDNILDKHHTDVSIGIAYDKYSFYMVQNFENNYIDYTLPISESNGIVSFAGNLKSESLYIIGVNYDPLPTSDLYEQHKNDGYYDLGDQLVTVQQPPQGSLYYPPSNDTFEVADKWIQQGSNVNVSFDMSPFVTRSGVYTVYVTLQDNNGNQFPMTSYSIIKNSPMVQEGFRSSKVYYACTSDQLAQYTQLQQEADGIDQQINSMKPQVQNIPATVPEGQYSYDEGIINHYKGLVNQYNSLENQLENFRC